jgi:hypothetical protein
MGRATQRAQAAVWMAHMLLGGRGSLGRCQGAEGCHQRPRAWQQQV